MPLIVIKWGVLALKSVWWWIGAFSCSQRYSASYLCFLENGICFFVGSSSVFSAAVSGNLDIYLQYFSELINMSVLYVHRNGWEEEHTAWQLTGRPIIIYAYHYPDPGVYWERNDLSAGARVISSFAFFISFHFYHEHTERAGEETDFTLKTSWIWRSTSPPMQRPTDICRSTPDGQYNILQTAKNENRIQAYILSPTLREEKHWCEEEIKHMVFYCHSVRGRLPCGGSAPGHFLWCSRWLWLVFVEIIASAWSQLQRQPAASSPLNPAVFIQTLCYHTGITLTKMWGFRGFSSVATCSVVN